ncbi:unnamed protein product [Urochloa humidicola]
MKPQVVLVALAVAVVVLAALPLGHGIGERAEAATASEWPCCDSCSVCTRSLPPQCRCADSSPKGCHPARKNCVKSKDDDGSDVFHCTDKITNFCKRRCTPKA